MPVRERNRIIVERWSEGTSVNYIAAEFGISCTMVRHVLQDHAQAEERRARCSVLLEAIRAANDIDREWDRADLLDCMDYPQRVRRLLDRCLASPSRISLRQLMDWCLPVVHEEAGMYEWLPALGKYGFGSYGVGDLIRSIDRMDFGPAFGAEWKKRRAAFRDKFCGGLESGRRSLFVK